MHTNVTTKSYSTERKQIQCHTHTLINISIKLSGTQQTQAECKLVQIERDGYSRQASLCTAADTLVHFSLTGTLIQRLNRSHCGQENTSCKYLLKSSTFTNHQELKIRPNKSKQSNTPGLGKIFSIFLYFLQNFRNSKISKTSPHIKYSSIA